MSKILQNEIQCNKCGQNIWSSHRHDFKWCSCGSVAVDGGMDYLKRSVKDDCSYTDLSISINEDTLEALDDQLNWCMDTGRNNLGVICAIMRTLRDQGYNIEVDG